MSTQQQNVPTLRFPDFDENWKVSPIGDYTELISGVALKGEEITENKNHQIILRGINITEGNIRHSDDIDRYYSGRTKLAEKFYVKNGDMVIGMDGSKVGKNVAIVSEVDAGSILIQRVARVRHKENADICFIYQKVFSSDFHKYVDAVNTSSAIPHISLQQIRDYSIGFPSLPEQQKIASFLTAIDAKIELLTKKKALLEHYKKGVMQQLFSQKLRFKDDEGNEFPEWEEKKLGDVSKNVMYGMNSSAIKFDGVNKYIRITDIDENSRAYIPSPLTSPDGKIEEKYRLGEGDIVFARTGASVGKSYLYNKLDGNLYFAGFLIKFSVLNQNPNFIYYQTLTSNYSKWVQMMSMRSGQPGINAEEYKSFTLHLPSIPEQNKIAAFIESIGMKVEVIQKQIDYHSAYKKGLLQQLFV